MITQLTHQLTVLGYTPEKAMNIDIYLRRGKLLNFPKKNNGSKVPPEKINELSKTLENPIYSCGRALTDLMKRGHKISVNYGSNTPANQIVAHLLASSLL